MKFIYIFSLAGILSSQIYAQNDKDFINESWYNSAEMKSTADLVKIYDQNCVTQENEACSQLGASILEKFKNPEFTESAITEYYGIKSHTFYKALQTLYTANVIKPTTRKSVYIVNHNYIFRGNYTEFIQLYKEMYNDKDVIVNEDGKIVLDY